MVIKQRNWSFHQIHIIFSKIPSYKHNWSRSLTTIYDGQCKANNFTFIIDLMFEACLRAINSFYERELKKSSPGGNVSANTEEIGAELLAGRSSKSTGLLKELSLEDGLISESGTSNWIISFSADSLSQFFK